MSKPGRQYFWLLMLRLLAPGQYDKTTAVRGSYTFIFYLRFIDHNLHHCGQSEVERRQLDFLVGLLYLGSS